MSSYIRVSTVGTLLHILAAGILILFSVSHFVYLFLEGSLGSLVVDAENPVFPFLTNKAVVFVAALFEFVIALVCFAFRGHRFTNVAILFFIGVIAWYRWAFHYAGGIDCSCTGVLGRFLHFSKSAEKALPIVALGILALSTTPWLCSFLRAVPTRAVKAVLVSLLLLGCVSAQAQQSTEIDGQYRTFRCNRSTRLPVPQTEQTFAFTVIFHGDAWAVAVTNLTDSTKWERLVYDGTNLFYLTHYDGHFGSPAAESNTTTFAAIGRTPVYNPPVMSYLDLFVPWIGFGLSPHVIANAPNNSLPLPWHVARLEPLAFGYKWNATNSHDGRFIEGCEIVRSKSLDMDEEHELLRPDMDYPLSLPDRRAYIASLHIRKDIPDGFVIGRYACTNWAQTNGISIPLSAQFDMFEFHPKYGKTPSYQAVIQTTRISVVDPVPALLPSPGSSVEVRDYRYKTNSPTHIFAYADYTLHAGDGWKSADDPVLRAKAADWLKNGPRYDAFSHKRNILTWLVFAGMLALPALAMLFGKKKKQVT